MCVRIQLIIHLFTSSKTHRRVAIIELVLLLTSNTTITQSFWFKLEPSSVRRWKMHVMTMMFSDTKHTDSCRTCLVGSVGSDMSKHR